LPFCHVRLNGPKPKSKAYPKELKTIGDHIRKRRLDLNLLQKQVAEQIGDEITSVFNWESNESQPATRFFPAIICFLGYNPLPVADDLMGKFARTRQSLGLTQEDLAEKLGIDESTIAQWERREKKPIGPYRKVVENFVASDGSLPDLTSRAVPEGGFSPNTLVSVRKALGVSRAALARKLDISAHTIWRWERGDRKPGGLYLQLVGDLIRRPI
jgi:DNA-binding transcriptional regulator YiaG